MSLLFETIRLQDGVLHNIEYHNQRMNKSRKTLFGSSDVIDLQRVIKIPETYSKGVFKCRVLYGEKTEDITFEPYTPRSIKSLRLIEADTLDYSHKYTNRESLNQLFSQRGSYDDILIVKNGLITDTSYTNIIFHTGNEWITPVAPLLNGTMRSSLLHKNLISVNDIRVRDLTNFHSARLINAMLPFETSSDIPVGNIGF